MLYALCQGGINMQITEKQLEQVKDRIRALIDSTNFYGKKRDEAGISEVN